MSNKNNPTVSIIMPAYNAERFIGQSIDAIRMQTYRDWELIIADDNSTDRSPQIINQFAVADDRIKYIKLNKNQGAAIARNEALKIARGRYIAFCDSDDRWTPNKLQKQIQWMTTKGVEVSYTSYFECDEENILIGTVIAPPKVSFKEIAKCDYMGFLTFVYDTKRIGKIEIPNLRKRQDWALKLKIMQQVEYAEALVEPLAYYRVRKGSLSKNKWKLVEYNINVYKNVLNYSTTKAWIVFLCKFIPNYFVKRLKYKLGNTLKYNR